MQHILILAINKSHFSTILQEALYFSKTERILLRLLKVPGLPGDLWFEVFDRYVTSIEEERKEEGSRGDKIEN